ncbi:MAG: CPBP family intramembrane metalloprotease [Bacillaceae bacterium]|nr:CPBP family intramembrane metalloprotease [Bacillaceae bacterium]
MNSFINIHRKNPLIPFVITLASIFIIIGLIILSISTSKGNLGESLASLSTKKAYTFSHLQTTVFDSLELDWEEPITVIPLYDPQSMLQGLVVVGNGNARLLSPDEELNTEYALTGAYIPITQQAWDYIYLNGQKQEVPLTPAVTKKMRSLLEHRSFLYLSVELFGYQRIFTEDKKAGHYLLATTPGGQLIRYHESDHVEFQVDDRPPVLFDKQAGRSESILKGLSLPNIMVIIGIMTAALSMTYVLTLQFTRKRPLFYIGDSHRYPGFVSVITLFSLFIVYDVMKSDQFIGYQIAITVGLILLALIPYVYMEKGYILLGIGKHNLFSSMLVAAILAVIFQWFGSLQIPTDLKLALQGGWLLWIWQFPLIAFLQEIYWRGILQRIFIRWTGWLWGLLLTALTFSIYTYFQLSLSDLVSGDSLLIQSFLIAPVEALILGYFYWKTNNLWSTAFLHMLIMLLPEILIY